MRVDKNSLQVGGWKPAMKGQVVQNGNDLPRLYMPQSAPV